MAKAIFIFDLDGTLVDTAPDLLSAVNWLLSREQRRALGDEEIRRIVGRGAKNLISTAFAMTGDEISGFEVEMLYRAFLKRYASHVAAESRPYLGVEESLTALKAEGFALGVLTNKPHDLSVQLLEELGLSPFFGAVTGQGRRAYMKPDPRIFTEIVEELGSGPAVMIGDSRTDVETARAAGAPVALVSYGYTPEPAAILGADAVADSFAEAVAAARKLLGV
jgi:2-phosphoglycolate phosphatase, prokaryotic